MLVKNCLTDVKIKILSQLPDTYSPGREAEYNIIMSNDFLNPRGKIIKKQEIKGQYKRSIHPPVEAGGVTLGLGWTKAVYSSQSKKNSIAPINWEFARSVAFHYTKRFGCGIYPPQIISKNEFKHQDFSECFKQFPALPAVNLLYLFSWDIIMFEEFHRLFLTALLDCPRRINEVIEIDAMNNMKAHPGFKGCSIEKSFFLNKKFYGKILGIGLMEDREALIIEYRSSGHIRVASDTPGKVQEGESFYLGKIYIDLIDFDLLFADMIEILTVSTADGNKQKISSNKRRMINLTKKSGF